MLSTCRARASSKEMASRRAAASAMKIWRSVSIRSGRRLLIVTLWRATSSEIAFIAAGQAGARRRRQAHEGARGVVTMAEVMLTMRSKRRAIMPGSSALVRRSGAVMLRSAAAVPVRLLGVEEGAGAGPALLLTRMSAAGRARSSAARPSAVVTSQARPLRPAAAAGVDLGHRALDVGRRAAGDEHVDALGRQGRRAGPAEAPARAADHGRASLQSQIHARLPWRAGGGHPQNNDRSFYIASVMIDLYTKGMVGGRHGAPGAAGAGRMHITAAVSRAVAAPMSIETIELAEPRDDEVLVRLVASGICRTDLAMRDHKIYPIPHPPCSATRAPAWSSASAGR